MESINATYTEEYCHALELAYGKNMMSDGGEKTVDMMFKGIELKGKKVLDFGSGLGGMAFYIAQGHEADVTGLEINPTAIKMANTRMPAPLKDRVRFILGEENGNLPFPDASFDIIFSAGVLVHLTSQQKIEVFKEFYRLLKPGGFLVIRDCLSPTDDVWGGKIQQLMETENLPLYACSPASYIKMLKTTGFIDVNSTDYSETVIGFNEEVVERLKSPEVRQEFINNIGEQTLNEHLEGYENMIETYQTGELIANVFEARKP